MPMIRCKIKSGFKWRGHTYLPIVTEAKPMNVDAKVLKEIGDHWASHKKGKACPLIEWPAKDPEEKEGDDSDEEPEKTTHPPPDPTPGDVDLDDEDEGGGSGSAFSEGCRV